MDMSRTKIPTVAIVLAIVFALLCLIGLLFLLMKEKQTTGFIQVTVTSGGRHHTTMIRATGPDTIHRVMGQLNYARSLSMSEPVGRTGGSPAAGPRVSRARSPGRRGARRPS
ncbi:hypothetical protein SANTM175S_07188 [Streptomyces antimycoticus]